MGSVEKLSPAHRKRVDITFGTHQPAQEVGRVAVASAGLRILGWSAVLNEMAGEEAQERNALDAVRRKHLKKSSGHTRCNAVACYSGWLVKPGGWGADIR